MNRKPFNGFFNQCVACIYKVRLKSGLHISFQLTYDIRHIRRYISLSVAKTIATAFITCRHDYCISQLYNILCKDILRLQCIQNYLARVVTLSPRFSHSIPHLKSLHWLPVQYRIIFKINTIADQTLSYGESSYLFSMLSLAPKPR